MEQRQQQRVIDQPLCRKLSPIPPSSTNRVLSTLVSTGVRNLHHSHPSLLPDRVHLRLRDFMETPESTLILPFRFFPQRFPHMWTLWPSDSRDLSERRRTNAFTEEEG